MLLMSLFLQRCSRLHGILPMLWYFTTVRGILSALCYFTTWCSNVTFSLSTTASAHVCLEAWLLKYSHGSKFRTMTTWVVENILYSQLTLSTRLKLITILCADIRVALINLPSAYFLSAHASSIQFSSSTLQKNAIAIAQTTRIQKPAVCSLVLVSNLPADHKPYMSR